MAEPVYDSVNAVADGGAKKSELDGELSGIEADDAGLQGMGKMAQLVRKRTALKGQVTKRLNRVAEILEASGSRKKLQYYRTALLEAVEGMKQVAYELGSLNKDESHTWLQTEKDRINEAICDVDEYIEARMDDLSTNSSQLSIWLKDYHMQEKMSLKSTGGDGETMVGSHGEMDVLTQRVADVNGGIGNSKRDERTQQARNLDSGVGNSRRDEHLQESRNVNSYVGNSKRDEHLEDPRNLRLNEHVIDSSRKERNFNDFEDPDERNGRCNDVPRSGQVGLYNIFHHSSGVHSGNLPRARRGEVTGSTWVCADRWISDLCEREEPRVADIMRGQGDGAIAALLTQQILPRLEIPKFSGDPGRWLEFITKFHDLVHTEVMLNGIRKASLLFQHLTGEARRATTGLSTNWKGYVTALKRIKYLFGDVSVVASTVIKRISQGATIRSDNGNHLSQFLYDISDAIIALGQLGNDADLRSSEVLNLTAGRLSKPLRLKWGEHVSRLKARGRKPDLLDFEKWLRDRIISLREVGVFEGNETKTDAAKGSSGFNGMINKRETDCRVCQKGTHSLTKCDVYQSLDAEKRFARVSEMKLCFNCLGKTHRSRECKSRYKCYVNACGKKHHSSLHGYFTKGSGASSSEKQREGARHNEDKVEKDSFNGILDRDESEMYLQIVPVILRSNEGKEVSTYALLDTGSHVTLVREDIASKLDLPGKSRSLNIGTIKELPKRVRVKAVSLSVVSKLDGRQVHVKNAFSMPKAEFRMPSQPCPVDYNNPDIYTHLDGIELEPVEKEDIGILIGADCPEALLIEEVRRGKDNQPFVVLTKWGWTLFGSGRPGHELDVTVSLLHAPRDIVPPGRLYGQQQNRSVIDEVDISAGEHLDSQVERFWKQENDAISLDSGASMSVEDSIALEKLQNDTKLIDGHYQVPMLWRCETGKLPNNIGLVRKRFELLKRRLRKNPELNHKFRQVIEDYVKKGFAKRLSAQEASVASDRTWYLPIHPVFNANKPGKVRVVNDAAAKYQGISLNDSLTTGPDLLNGLIGILLNFRIEKIAIVADIEAMFHQVRVNETDADSLRFLWTDDIFKDGAEYTMRMNVHIFGARDSLTCAIFALQRTALDNSNKFSPEAVSTVLNNFYVDDMLKSVESEEQAKKLVSEVTELLRAGGFRLTKWLSNSQGVLEAIPSGELAKDTSVSLDKDRIEKALGVIWDVSTDVFTYKFEIEDVGMTKRSILKVTSSIFDPLGIIAPFIF